MKSLNRSFAAHTMLGALILPSLAFAAPTITKIHNFYRAPRDPDDVNYTPPPGPSAPLDSAILIGNQLWFTTQKGGNDDVRTLTSYNLNTNTSTVRANLSGSFDPTELPGLGRAWGGAPQGGVTRYTEPGVDGLDLLYYLTPGGGTGNRGVLNSYNLDTGVSSTLWQALPSTPAPNAINPGAMNGNVVVFDRGEDGKDFYFVTSGGGPGGGGAGTLLRYNSLTNVATIIQSFSDAPEPRNPVKGLIAVGTKLYFTTSQGGLVREGLTPNGAGTLNEVDVTVSGEEVYRRLANLPPGDGSTGLPQNNPYYRALNHSLYITTSGTAREPGSIQRFDLTTEKLTTIYELQGAAVSAGPFPEGRFAYGSLSEWNRELYFNTMGGGANGTGTINRFRLDTGTHEVLTNMPSSGASDTLGTTPRGGFTFNESDESPSFYMLTQKGGTNNLGTIVRIDLDAKVGPTAYEIWRDEIYSKDETFVGVPAVPNGDADHDGLSNKVEYAFGSDPTLPNPTASTMVHTVNGLEIRWNALTDGNASYLVQGSPTLGEGSSPWTTVAQTPVVMTTPDVVVPEGYERRQVTIPLDEAVGFFRVEAAFQGAAVP